MYNVSVLGNNTMYVQKKVWRKKSRELGLIFFKMINFCYCCYGPILRDCGCTDNLKEADTNVCCWYYMSKLYI